MTKKTKIDKVVSVAIMRDGSKWLINSFDELTVKGWSSLDEIETETFGLNKGLNNLTKKKKITAEPL